MQDHGLICTPLTLTVAPETLETFVPVPGLPAAVKALEMLIAPEAPASVSEIAVLVAGVTLPLADVTEVKFRLSVSFPVLSCLRIC